MKTIKILLFALSIAALGIFASCNKENTEGDRSSYTYSVTTFSVSGTLETVQSSLRSELDQLCSGSKGKDKADVKSSAQSIINKYVNQAGRGFKYDITITIYKGGSENGFILLQESTLV